MMKKNRRTARMQLRMDDESSLMPHHVRSRLNELFSQIEREFDHLCADNYALQEKIDGLQERLEGAGGEKLESVADSGIKAAAKKSGQQISQRLKSTYKSSTSKLVSSFRPSNSGGYQVERLFCGHGDGVWEVNASSVNPLICTASADHTVRLWNADSGLPLLQFTDHRGSVNSARFHPTEDLIVSASGDQTVKVWSYPTSQLENAKPHSSGDEELDGNEANVIDSESANESEERHELMSIRNCQQTITLHSSVVSAAEWMSCGHKVISSSWDRQAYLAEVETGQLITSLTGHDQELLNVSAHSSQSLVLTASKDTTFRLWDLRDRALQVNVFQGHAQEVTTAVFTLLDKLVSASDDRSVKVWDMRNMQSACSTIRVDSPANRLSVSQQQGTMLIAIPHDNRQIRLFDLNGIRVGRLPRTSHQGHTQMVCSVAWSEKETAVCRLFSAGFDRKVLGWSISI